MQIREATDDDITTVLGLTHALWGGDAPLAAYVSRTKALFGSSAGRELAAFIVGVDDAGRILTACKRYRLAMRQESRILPTVGFGAVFTAPEHRRAGHAAAMLKGVMAQEAARGARLALLFTDIGPDYYERLGFREVACDRATAEAMPGPAPFEGLGDRSSDSLLAFSTPADPGLALVPSPAYWRYKLQRNRPELLVYAPGGTPKGFLALHASPQGLFVEEAGYAPNVDATEFWRAVRSLAHGRGLPAVAGWLPRSTAPAGFTFAPLPTARPMIAPLAGDVIPPTVQFWANDHF
jgi:GNAT superfamily N-acetyltransferase